MIKRILYFFRSLNYGALGVVLGHELSHGFDNIGKMYTGLSLLPSFVINNG